MVKTNVYVEMKCKISDNLTKFFMIHEMYGYHYMIIKEINIILVFVILVLVFFQLLTTSSTHAPERKETKLQCTN